MKRDKAAIACIQGRPIRCAHWSTGVPSVVWVKGEFRYDDGGDRCGPARLEEADDWIVVGEPELCTCGHGYGWHMEVGSQRCMLCGCLSFRRPANTWPDDGDDSADEKPELCVCGHPDSYHPPRNRPCGYPGCVCDGYHTQRCEPPEPEVLRLPTVWRFGELSFIAPGEHRKKVANAGGYSTGDYRFAGLVYMLPCGEEIILGADAVPIWCRGGESMTWMHAPHKDWTRTYPVAVLMSKVGKGEK